MTFIADYSDKIEKIQSALAGADLVLIGAGAGLSAAAGLSYTGERFERYFADFHQKYGITDMYGGGFYPFGSLEEYWAWWSRHILYNRYEVEGENDVYPLLLSLVGDKDYFVLTTNVDHRFQNAGFDKERLFYTQGDYGLFQCSRPCHKKTYDNEEIVRAMAESQLDMKIPSALIPRCPVCGRAMNVNLRCDDTFVEDEGWHAAQRRYEAFRKRCKGKKVVLLELGVGYNTPVIIKYPFWKIAAENPQATYVCVNAGEAFCPREIESASICLNADIRQVLQDL